MYEGYKFNNLRKIILYVISKNQGPMKHEEICKELGGINETSIYSSMKAMEKNGFLKKFNRKKGKEALFGINVRKMDKIKKELNEHWESQWGNKWENVAKRRIP